MIELQALALATLPARLLQSRFGCVSARRAIAANPKQLFNFLSDIENHWLIAEGFVESLPSELTGGVHVREVRLRGPLGLRRKARTCVLLSHAPRLIVGRAVVGRRTVARISWVLARGPSGSTDVELSAVIERLGALDGLVLLLGGKRLLEGHFEGALRLLAGLAVASGELDRFQRGEPHAEPLRDEAA